MNSSQRPVAKLASSGTLMAASRPSAARRPWVLRYVLVVLVSALLHAGGWQLRNFLDFHSEILPKPKPPIEVTLVPVPEPLAEDPALTAPSGEKADPEPAKSPSKPAALPPGPVAKPVEAKTPPAPKPAAKPKPPHPIAAPPAPPHPIEPRPKPARRTKTVDEPDPNVPRTAEPIPSPPPRPRPPVRRESELDPNLPPLVRPAEKTPEPPLTRRPAKPQPLPGSRGEADPNLPPAERPTPQDTGTVRETTKPTARLEATPGGPASAASTPVKPSTAPAGGKSGPAGGDKPGGAFEGAKANAAYLHNPKPEYPPIARRRQWEGRVILRVRVLAAGTVAAATVETSSGHEVLDEAALEAVRRWHFVPAKRGGQAVDSVVNVPINFNLLDSQ